jgi:hypothetical protein
VGTCSPAPPFFVFLQHHHQLSVEGEHVPFFLFLFLLFFKPHHQDSTKRELALPFFIFLVAFGAHGQISAKRKLELPLFFLFLFFFSYGCKWAPSPSLGKGGASAPLYFILFYFLILFCCF